MKFNTSVPASPFKPMLFMWRRVLEQALEDAVESVRAINAAQYKRMDALRAREWLTQPNKDFEEVCALAQLEADRVRSFATKMIAETSVAKRLAMSAELGDRTQ